MFVQRYLNAVGHMRLTHKHVIARVVFGILMLLIGFSYATRPGGVIAQFHIYGQGVPSMIAALYVLCGVLMILLCRFDMAVYMAFPNFLYMGMALQLAVNGEASWSGFWYIAGVLTIALIAIMRGRQPLIPGPYDREGRN